MRRVLVALSCLSASAAACAAVLGVDDVEYQGAADAATDVDAQGTFDASARDDGNGGDGGGATTPDALAPDGPRPTIACQSGACAARTQECCLTWTTGLDTCFDGHGPCTLDGSTETTFIECDDPTDCAAWAGTATVCCLTTNDPTGGRFTSRCVQPGTCAGPSKLVMCDPAAPNICQDEAHCLEFNSTYNACQ